ncbi:VanZ family protein [Changpingibacter yushuensis]|uniref:VanZ family protein n=1 Tax=Changpingibacter yushuensis TaxID=2758440 RepID=UPI0015F5D6F3|nr:VanZ family protein [Changpingibacter yushuensis]
MRRSQWVGVAGFTLTALVVLVITLSPNRVDEGRMPEIIRFLTFWHSHGLPSWFRYKQLEFSANIVMTIPLGLFAGMALPKPKRQIAFIALPVMAALVELSQALFLAGRVASIWDVVANSLGAWIGLLVAIYADAEYVCRQRTVLRQPIE